MVFSDLVVFFCWLYHYSVISHIKQKESVQCTTVLVTMRFLLNELFLNIFHPYIIQFNLSISRNLNVWLDVPELSLESRDNFLSCHCLLKKNKLLIRMTLIDFRTAILLKTSQQTCLTITYESARSHRVIQGQFFS